MPTLLERWDDPAILVTIKEIRRALAIAEIVEKRLMTGNLYQTREAREIQDEAEELLRGESKDPRNENSAYGSWLRGEK